MMPLSLCLLGMMFLNQLIPLTLGLKPSPRWANGCIILTGSLFCFGGQKQEDELSNELYRIDLSNAWDTSRPPWELVAVQSPTVERAYFAMTPCWTEAFIVNGGITAANGSTASPFATYLYDTQRSTWGIPKIHGDTALRRRQHSATADYQGRVWFWGGVSDPSTGSSMNVYYSMWTVLDTNTWAYSSPTVNGGMPAPRIDHTATMLSNQHIMILGGLVFTKNVTDPIGRQTLLPVSMNQLLLYDMANAQWKTITAGGNIPAPRRGHSAVLHRGKASIIVFGGGTPDDDEDMLNDVFVLRLSDYEWNSPSIYGVPPKPRKYHQANLMDQLMLVSFGSAPGNDGYNDVNILDTAEWQWISTYTPNPKWLSGNFSSSGVISNSSGTHGNPYESEGQGMYPYPLASHVGEANGGSAAANTPNSNGGSSETRIKAGVIAGIISGAVVVLGGGIFLLLSKVLYQQRQVKDKISILPKSASSESVPFPTKPLAQPLAGVHPRPSSVITLTDLGERQVAKPDNRSSYGYATDDGLQHKPNEHDTIPPT